MHSPRLLTLIIALLTAGSLSAESLLPAPERRKLQFPTEGAHLLVPLPYSLPGIGEGYFLMGYLSNLYDTTTDTALVLAQGDASGLIGQVDEIPLIEDRLHLQLFSMNIDKATINDYETRGMEGGDSFNVVELSSVRQSAAELTLSLWERRLALGARYGRFANEIASLRDRDGNILTSINQTSKNESDERSVSAMLDLTDDYQDPRDGLRLRLNLTDHPAKASDDPDFFTLDYSLLYYLPINGVDTIAFNLYRSDAHVRSSGELDPAAVRTSLGSSCSVGDQACLDAENQRVENILAGNRYGTATSLGGTDRLRSFGDGRFSGAHMEFVGVEFRSNFVSDAKPFDYFIWKDITTSIQLALFAEAGSVAETRDRLWDEYRSSVGIGARLVSASGSVYRADWATGNEGSEFSVFFFYPWY